MVNNNELADFISRVPDNEELVSGNINLLTFEYELKTSQINNFCCEHGTHHYVSEKLQGDIRLG